MGTAATQIAFQATSNSRVGSIRTGCRSPRNARSDMAVNNRQMTTPSITGRDRATWMRIGHVTMASPTR